MASTTTAPGARTARGSGLTLARVAYSELIKLRSLRSTIITLSASVVLTVGTGVLLCLNARAHVEAGRHLGTDPAVLTLYGAYLAPVTVGALGVLFITGEYATGMIRSTLAAVPRRLPVLWAKAGVLALAVMVISEAALLVTFLAGQAILSATPAGVSLADPGVLRAVTGTGLYVTVVGLLGMALGFVIRSTAGAITTLFGVLLVAPVLVNVLPAGWTGHIAPYLPSNAGQAIMLVQPAAGFLAPWTGLALFAGYAAAAVAVAAVTLKWRDA
jgi:ABC-type transport system involved in multi-copper enzyme maturation permease subunit